MANPHRVDTTWRISMACGKMSRVGGEGGGFATSPQRRTPGRIFGQRMLLALAVLVLGPLVATSEHTLATSLAASRILAPRGSSLTAAPASAMRLRGGSQSPGGGRDSASPSKSGASGGGRGSWAKKLFPEGGKPDDGDDREGRALRPRSDSEFHPRSRSSATELANRSLSKEEETAVRDTKLKPVENTSQSSPKPLSSCPPILSTLHLTSPPLPGTCPTSRSCRPTDHPVHSRPLRMLPRPYLPCFESPQEPCQFLHTPSGGLHAHRSYLLPRMRAV